MNFVNFSPCTGPKVSYSLSGKCRHPLNQISSIGTLTNNIWYHIAITFNTESDIRIYINGSEDNNGSGSFNDTSTLLEISDPNYEVDGLIDEVKIFNYALTPQQVRTEYNGGAVRFGN